MRTLSLYLFLASALTAADPALTIYNQDFAVIRDTVPLDLQKGENRVTFQDVTGLLEPESVMLRDPSGRIDLRIVEQNYRADPLSPDMLLSRFEGKTIQFLVTRADRTDTVEGKIVRAGVAGVQNPYSQAYVLPSSPIIEVDGKLRFSLPGEPLFPALGDDTILKPSLNWVIAANRAARLDAELAYVTRGMTWSADYNVISAPLRGEVDLIGWVTMQNNTGKTFDEARIKLMAGDVNKVRPAGGVIGGVIVASQAVTVNGPSVIEKTFDEYHLYTLEHATTLHDRETKQVEFLRADNVSTTQIYVYDGLKLDPQRYAGWNYDNIRNDSTYGTASNTKVRVMREFQNSAANHLGIPLPAGRVRFYQQDADRQLEFTGEDNIQHTPKDETVRVFTGNAFDLTAARELPDRYGPPAGRRILRDQSTESQDGAGGDPHRGAPVPFVDVGNPVELRPFRQIGCGHDRISGAPEAGRREDCHLQRALHLVAGSKACYIRLCNPGCIPSAERDYPA